MGSLRGQGTKIPHATGQISQWAKTRESPLAALKTKYGQNNPCIMLKGASLVAQMVKNPPAVQETWV